MNDLEICKRIAEIEGHEKSLFEGVGERDFYIKSAEGFNATKYNPLTDDALCFRLMNKYKVDIMQFDTVVNARIYEDPDDDPVANQTNANTNKAICLAIIEANKDK